MRRNIECRIFVLSVFQLLNPNHGRVVLRCTVTVIPVLPRINLMKSKLFFLSELASRFFRRREDIAVLRDAISQRQTVESKTEPSSLLDCWF